MGVPAFLILGVVGIVLAAFSMLLRFREVLLKHKERMAALEKGVNIIPAADAPAPWSPRIYLLRGLTWTFTGAALTIALLGVTLTSRRPEPSLTVEQLAVKAGVVSQTLGIPMDQAREVVAKDQAAHPPRTVGPPIALALFGLIPLGVGLAYLTYYRSFESAGTAGSGA